MPICLYLPAFVISFYSILAFATGIDGFSTPLETYSPKNIVEHLKFSHLLIAFVLSALPYLNVVFALMGSVILVAGAVVEASFWLFSTKFMSRKVFQPKRKTSRGE
jgi:hypothetical protein